ncbi:ubiquitin carboxyl-terminal hydrolase [Metarhizium album ARSEF 1941]|uniref:ubiquitinyl hydrolase 1 n=1 Tax=Metarhizium album (strain ARSEF 1941) TaxID=1081103 RepID=A0A0B2WUI3_METAS|nr:ubiquitin carboxyl-terminal hydrolase [Metarhizium album ARSEF 1941]KHN97152.1 ubiquitin carboxyl-terminal hydrolase [Metarhizium album ARSEF 1941]
MAGRYDVSSQAQQASPYATLPGTSQAGFVPHNMTPMKSNLAPGREIAGCNPSRWVYELLNNNFTVCDLFERARHAKLESTYTWDHAHKLVMNGNQSYSTPSCRLTLEISEPRMPQTWVNLLLDREAICEQLRIAREQEPSRYEAATDEWANQATLNLNTYLKNLLESTPEDVRSISKRNKRFAVLFGPRCFAMFRQLEFTEKVELRDGVDEGFFTPSPPPPAGGPSETTEIGTYRSYLEDVRAEVQCLIHKAGQAAEKPTIITPVLHEGLGCNEVPNAATNALVNVERYRLIGVLPNQSREAVVNSYKRQWDLLPSCRRALVDSIMGIANDSGDELLSDYAITQSSVFDNQTHRPATKDDDGLVPQALNFLGLQPPNNYSADSLIQAFRQKLARDPADATTARSMLLLIAQNSNDDMYQAQLLMEADAKMSLETSRAILELKPVDAPWETTYEAAKKKIESSKCKEATQVYLDALEAIADHTYSPALKQAAMELRQENGIYGVKAKDDNEPVNYALPIGLHNIGNTCYLNSLLQYLFTVKPVRDIVLNYDHVKLALDDESIKARLLGGNKMQMDRGEAIVAQAFAKELSQLFQNLRASKQAATKPSQRLANAVLLSTHTLLHNFKQSSEPPVGSRPPPLPARPSPAPPIQSIEDVDMGNASVANVLEPSEMASNSSSRTLVDQEDAGSDHLRERAETVRGSGQADGVTDALSKNDDFMDQCSKGPSQFTKTENATEATIDTQESYHDVDMTDAEIETVDQKVLNALEHQKRSSGTDQQDVEEVMGSIINRLQAAIRPTSVDEKTGIQLEKIMETFFVTTINYTKKFDEKEYQSEISFDRSITAFPAPDGPCSLYDALGRNFDQQILEESKLSRYTAIKTLPPVLHVLIQRSQSMGSKNGNAVVIPETLYLDRYMDAPHASPVFRRRVEDWALSDRISDLKFQISKVDSNPTYLSYLEKYSAGALETEGADGKANTKSADSETPEIVSVPEENWDFDGPVDEDFLVVTPATSTSSEQLIPHEPRQNIRATDTAIRQMMEAELQQREQTLKEHQESLKGTPYRLHAVICHRGHLMSGHYWVWIHDFEENTWRWYNDADVRENKNTAEVLETLSTSGEPYFLCYVRDKDKADYVNVPKRQPPTPPSEPQENPALQTVTDTDGDIDAVTQEMAPVIEGIELLDDETGSGLEKGNGDAQRMDN